MMAKRRETVVDVPVMFGELNRKIDFLVVNEVPVVVLVRITDRKTLSTLGDRGDQYVRFTILKTSIREWLEYGRNVYKPVVDKAANGNFTTD